MIYFKKLIKKIHECIKDKNKEKCTKLEIIIIILKIIS